MRFTIPSAAVALALAALTAGCGAPGGSSSDTAKKTDQEAKQTVAKTDVAKAGKVTLTVWDQEVRGGQNAQMKQLNAAFQQKYPNVTIKRVAKSFTDLNTTLKLAVSGAKAPDVVEANQGRPIMGQLVKAGLLRPVDPYARAYGWEKRYSSVLLDLNRFSSDGKTFGAGNLYGLSQMGEIVGVFYNKDKVKRFPQTMADFVAQLKQAKAQGDVPIQFGNLDKYGGIHEYETVLSRIADKQEVRDFVFARQGATFDNPDFVKAATQLQDWAKAGYFTPNFNGVGYDPAWQQFAKGKGRFLIAGTWVTADLAKQMGDKVGFELMPGASASDQPVALGGESLPFTITSKSKHPDVAAAYIDFITNPDAAKVLAQTNNLPAMPVDQSAVPTTGLSADVFAQWKRLNAADGLIPYLDYTTPTFYDDISGGVQRLMAAKDSPKQFAKDMQSVYEKWDASR
jgi:raffinose/stachyose/melibiose transport system substrate-binding protein